MSCVVSGLKVVFPKSLGYGFVWDSLGKDDPNLGRELDQMTYGQHPQPYFSLIGLFLSLFLQLPEGLWGTLA